MPSFYLQKLYKYKIILFVLMLTYLLIRTKHGKNMIACDKLSKPREFIDLNEVYGRYDIVGLVESKDLNELRTFIQNKVWIIEDIEKVETLIVSNLKEEEPHEEDEPVSEEEKEVNDTPETDDDGQYLPA